MTNCTCGSGAHIKRCNIHPKAYLCHWLDLLICGVLDNMGEDQVSNYTVQQLVAEIVNSKDEIVKEFNEHYNE